MFEHAKWIWLENTAQPDEYADFRQSFFAKEKGEYKLYISCDSDYNLTVGGKLFFGQYGDYAEYKIYDCLDISEYVTEGENLLDFTVWYYGASCSTYIKKEAGLIFELYRGSELVCASGSGTLCRPSPRHVPHRCVNITSQLGISFRYDANRKGEKFVPCRVVDGISKKMFPRPVKKLVLGKRLESRTVKCGSFRLNGGDSPAERMDRAVLFEEPVGNVLVKKSGCDGVFAIFDLGAESTGFFDFDITVDEECEFEIGWGEHLKDGRCRTGIRNFSCEYRAFPGKNVHLHSFRRMGCRYVQFFAYTDRADVSYFGMRTTLYPVTPVPHKWKTPLRDRIYSVCVNTLRQCMHEHYEDCPWREQALYTLDSRNQMLCGYYAFGETIFPKASLELISHAKRNHGLLSLCCPAENSNPIPSFSLIYFIQIYEYALHTKDTDFVRSKYRFLKDLISVFENKYDPCGLIENFSGEGDFWNFYEWSEGMSGSFGEKERHIEAPLNAFFSLALGSLSAVAAMIGEDRDSAYYKKEAEKINAALKEKFFDPSVGLFESFDTKQKGKYSVLTNSLCLLCGAAEGTDKTVILKILAANGAADTGLYVIPNTLSMNCFRFDALLAYDREKYRGAILDEIDREYGKMLDAGATSFWETALGEADFGGAGSLCHGWSALPVYYYSILGA